MADGLRRPNKPDRMPSAVWVLLEGSRLDTEIEEDYSDAKPAAKGRAERARAKQQTRLDFSKSTGTTRGRACWRPKASNCTAKSGIQDKPTGPPEACREARPEVCSRETDVP